MAQTSPPFAVAVHCALQSERQSWLMCHQVERPPGITPLPHPQFKGQRVLIGVDDMDLFKGIELKLLAVEQVLKLHDELRGRLVLIQITNAPRSVFP